MTTLYTVHDTPFAAADKSFRFGVLNIQRDWAWVSSVLPCHLVEDTSGIIAIDRHGRYAAVTVFDSWSPAAVSAHIAILDPMVIRHGFLNKVADSVFVHARKSVMIGTVPASNTKALRFDKHIGFVEVGRIRDGADHGDDLVILELRRETCRWITEDRYDG